MQQKKESDASKPSLPAAPPKLTAPAAPPAPQAKDSDASKPSLPAAPPKLTAPAAPPAPQAKVTAPKGAPPPPAPPQGPTGKPILPPSKAPEPPKAPPTKPAGSSPGEATPAPKMGAANASSPDASPASAAAKSPGSSAKAASPKSVKIQVRPLQIKIVSASGLRKADFMGKSDPYCIVEIDRAGEIVQTKVHTGVQKQTLDPVWDEVFELKEYHIGDKLVFKLFDSDADVKVMGMGLKGDDTLGFAHLDGDTIASRVGTFDLPVQEAGKGHEAAKLKVIVSDLAA
eukprot:TRINITY_DN5300_c0_g2_i1.p1 TRINITY_DN5300_c0_g2~~TRINITY_DN5300_c0_g2_i1.p1  ORF type:complete len:313 (-),score=103.89 TRINITY_DN5300_c0_g2_i1:159-1016(-)